MSTYYSNGKLLLTGEYLVLDGALSLAIPTQFGQSLIVEAIDEQKFIWQSFDKKGNTWFEDEFLIEEIATDSLKHHNDVSNTLLKIIKAAKQLNPFFLIKNHGYKVITELDFPRDWGLGSSSTLINNIANWANIDAYKLLELTFEGSGYDIACSQHNCPITYQLQNNNRLINKVDFNPSFKEQLYFIYLNKKQNSRKGIAHYKTNTSNHSQAILDINDITSKIIDCISLIDFETLITAHEYIISKILKQKPVKERLFNDFKGSIKSLGAWGGDFVLATSKEDPKSYFAHKGFNTIINYTEMVLNKKSLT